MVHACVYQGVLDPCCRAHQVLDTAVDNSLICCGKGAFLSLSHRPSVERLLSFVLRLSFWVIWNSTLWFGVLGARPLGDAQACEQPKGEFLEPILDDVHHIRTDVPDDVELVQKGECTPRVHPRCISRVAIVWPRPRVRGLSCFDCLSVSPRSWWVCGSLGAKGSVGMEVMSVG
jgi:hypothetical protein